MNDRNNKKIQIKIKQNYYFFNYMLFLSLILNVTLVESIISNYLRQLKTFNSEIHFAIQKNEAESSIIGHFNPEPSEILVNGVKKYVSSIISFFAGNNNLILRFDKNYEKCNGMFDTICFFSKVIEIDLSKFDVSKCLTMEGMFKDCSNLIKINFGNINTSSVVRIVKI